LLGVGSGVARRALEKPPEEKPDLEPTVEQDTEGRPKWFAEPSYEDQWVRYPNTCKEGPPIIDEFNVSDADERRRLNALLARTVPRTAPSVIVRLSKEQAHEGKWVMLVMYVEILYKKLISKPQ
jgi:hypothetical protein